MSRAKSANDILDTLEVLFPDAQAELDFTNPYELAIAVILSAQTTDVSVNKVTPAIFEAYPHPQDLAQAPLSDLEDKLKTIGLFRNKAKSLKGFGQALVDRHDSQVPKTRQELEALPGVGRKTANVILSVAFEIPAIAVDTHVHRTSMRLYLAKNKATVLETERALMKKIPQYRWNKAHHLLIFFGRYLCKAQNPECHRCPFQDNCRYYLKLQKERTS